MDSDCNLATVILANDSDCDIQRLVAGGDGHPNCVELVYVSNHY